MANYTTHHPQETTGWVGWVGFGAAMLGLVGIFHMLAGFVALFQDDVFFLTNQAVWIFDSSQWGWIHLGGRAFGTASRRIAASRQHVRACARCNRCRA